VSRWEILLFFTYIALKIMKMAMSDFMHGTHQHCCIMIVKFVNLKPPLTYCSWIIQQEETDLISLFVCNSWWGLGIFLLTTVPRMALGTTQPPIQ
jgi:hypothetical protein